MSQRSLFVPAGVRDDERRGPWIIGGDEAGRGPILGPMVLAVVALPAVAHSDAVDTELARELLALGVADSKKLGAGEAGRLRRATLDVEIRRCAAALHVEVVEVERIDAYTRRGQLNRLEQEVMTALLERLAPGDEDKIICDGARLFAPLQTRFPSLQAINRAEDRSPAVAAASILAKHTRDLEFAKVQEKYRDEFGELRGGGYPNPATYRFIEAYVQRYGSLPPEARSSWRRAPLRSAVGA